MAIPAAQYAQALESLVAENREEVSVIAKNFLRLLRKNGEISKGKRVLELLAEREAKRAGQEYVTVATAHELDSKTKKAVTEILQNHFPEQKIEVAYEVEPRLIGGFRARSREHLIDESLKGKLAQLHANINNA